MVIVGSCVWHDDESSGSQGSRSHKSGCQQSWRRLPSHAGLWVLFLLNFTQATYTADEHIISSCFDAPEKTMTASCAPGHMVRITRIMYGRSNTGSCAHTQGDCLVEDEEYIPCIGQQSCTINLPTGSLGRRIPACDQYSDYMQLHYQCVPVDSVYDMCLDHQATAPRGYIMTPMYPQRYPPARNCTLDIHAHSSQRIRLYILDLALYSNGGACHDYLYIKGALQSSSLCGRRGRELIFETHPMVNYLHLNFTSDLHNEDKGFWLYYEAFPPLPETTASPVLSSPAISSSFQPRSPDGIVSTVAAASFTLPPPAGSSASPSRPKPQPSHLPIEAIVGGVLGTLLCVLFILILLLVIKRRKENGIPSSTSTCQLHSKPMTPTPRGMPGPYIQNNLYGNDTPAANTRSHNGTISSGQIQLYTNV